MPWSGEGRRRILLVGEFPTEDDDETNRHFTGPAGRKLKDALAKFGVDLRQDCWSTNALICHPKRKTDGKEIGYCRPNLFRTIAELQPAVIIPLGQAAVSSLIGGVWKEDIGIIDRWVGWNIPCRKPNTWICPTWSPKYIVNHDEPAQNLWFEKHLKRAVRHKDAPWRGPIPRYEDSIEIITDSRHAARRIRSIMMLGDFPAAWDLETTCLKPDGPEAEIVSCSICWEGKTTIAYPWTRRTAEATSEFIRSKAPKIASNLKFESRWIMKKLRHGVRNWDWDTMQQAHVLDCRNPQGPGITSIKFQAFVRLGQTSYDDHIKPYFQPKYPGGPNRIRELNLNELLLYNGMDSLLEFQVATLQKKEMEKQCRQN